MGLRTLITTSTIQINSMTLVINKLLGVPMLLSGIVIAILIWLVIIKGIKGIAAVAIKFVQRQLKLFSTTIIIPVFL